MTNLVDVPVWLNGERVVYRTRTFYDATRYPVPGRQQRKPVHTRTETFVRLLPVAERLASANGNASYERSRGREPWVWVLAEYLDTSTGQWEPIEGIFS